MFLPWSNTNPLGSDLAYIDMTNTIIANTFYLNFYSDIPPKDLIYVYKSQGRFLYK